VRIAIVAPPWITVPPPAYGGVEQVVALQAEGLAGLGYDVTLFAPPGSFVPGLDLYESPTELPDQIGQSGVEARRLNAIVDELAAFDVVLDHSSPEGLARVASAGRPVVHVVHGPLVGAGARQYRAAASRSRNVHLVAISDAQRRSAPNVPFVDVCHNGIDVDAIPFRPGRGGYLAFLGRMCPEEGPSEAIAIARGAGRTLLIAATCHEEAEQTYFEREIRPRLGDDIVWMGELDRYEKYEFLGGADALLFPVSWDEPFALVVAEAMAAGTPVLATARGAVPEIVCDGLTGFVRSKPGELVALVGRLDEIDRTECRRRAQEHFSAQAMSARYDFLVSHVSDKLVRSPLVRDAAAQRPGRRLAPAAPSGAPSARTATAGGTLAIGR
jgi:glycosyltransferase involved in cell wall biosynthesis